MSGSSGGAVGTAGGMVGGFPGSMTGGGVVGSTGGGMSHQGVQLVQQAEWLEFPRDLCQVEV